MRMCPGLMRNGVCGCLVETRVSFWEPRAIAVRCGRPGSSDGEAWVVKVEKTVNGPDLDYIAQKLWFETPELSFAQF